MITDLINIFLEFSESLGYPVIVLLMTIESSFIPFPSEIIIPPAAYLASVGELNIFLVIASGITGSLIGAIINYYIAYYLGRAIIYNIVDHKIFKVLLINSRKIKRSEDFFLKYGKVSTFTGRLLPVIRQLISLPAGFSKMSLKYFCFYTFLGSGIWVTVLAILVYSFGEYQEVFLKYYKEVGYGIVFIGLIVISGIVLYKKYFKIINYKQ